MSDGDRPHVVVVGAGIAGLAAARDLRNQGIDVTIVDRGQTIGGRLLTRSPHPGPGAPRFDLGPQYLLGGNEERCWRGMPFGADGFGARQMLQELNLASAACDRPIAVIGRAHGEPADGEAPLPGAELSGMTIREGMRRIAFAMQPPPPGDVQTNPYIGQTAVVKIEPAGRKWRVRTLHTTDGTEDAITTDGVVLTAPVPQAVALAEASGISLPQNTRDELRSVRYSRCIAVAASFDGPSHLPEGGGVLIEDSALAWVTDNAAREVSPVGPALTGLSSDAWATDHWDDPDDAVLRQLLPLLRSWAGGEPRDATVHRWEFARPQNPLRVACVVAQQEPPLVFAGDGFASYVPVQVAAAYTSGRRAATQVLGLFAAAQRRERRFKVGHRPRVALEVCVTSAEEATVAAQMGADRVELCSALEVGGVTPSPHTFLAVREAVTIPVYVLLRPRTGGFTYSHPQFESMKRDAEWFLANGANGLVFGILTHDGGIDHERCRELVELCGGKAVFHRAFDFVPNPLVALEELIALGFERVQTSGRAGTAEGGMGRIHGWVQHAGWQIEIMPAGGITPATAAQLLRVTGADQIHGSFRTRYADATLALNPGVAASMGGSGAEQFFTDAETVQLMRQELNAFVTCPPTEEEE